MRSWITCLAPRDKPSRASARQQDTSLRLSEKKLVVNASQTTSRPSTSFDLSVHNTHASSLASSLSAFLSEVPSVITVFEAGLLDAGYFCDPTKTHAPVSYQTNFASDYYDQALNLQGEKVTLRQVIDHLLDQHPNGLISALSEMQEAISDGKQWKHICKVKVPVAMKASSDSPSIFTPVKQVPPRQLPSSPQLSLPSVFSSLRGESTSGVTPFTVPSSILHRTPSRTLSFLKRIGESTAGLQHQMPQQLEEVADTPTNDPPEYQFGVDAVILRELGMDELAADSAFDCVILEEDEVEDHIEPSHACLWHEVVVKPFVDPTSGKRLVMIQQNDVTLHLDLLINVSSEIDMASVCGKLSERQMALLSASFPRHVLEHLVDPLKLEQASNSSNIMQSNMSEDFLMDLPTELDPSSKLLMRPCPKDMASIPSKGFEKLARSHQDVTILFMDIVGFTTMSKQVAPALVMSFLNKLFSLFDCLTDKYGIQKIETAGDCYVAATGILMSDGEGFSVVKENGDPSRNAMRMLQFAKAMLMASKRVLMPHNHLPVNIRIGLHTGDCVTGVVGSKLPKFSVFGDTMNTASRMESTCNPGQIQVSESTWQLLKDKHQWKSSGGVEVKGKGWMNTYLWMENNDCTDSAGPSNWIEP